MSYEFADVVGVESTGDAKEHKESAAPSGRTEGEFRWLHLMASAGGGKGVNSGLVTSTKMIIAFGSVGS